MALTEKERLTYANALTQIDLAKKAAQALRYAYQYRPQEIEGDIAEDDWIRWDALTVRFARLADILTQRVFRAIDVVEFMPAGSTFIDRINRAEKRGHIQSVFSWKEIREVRNQIVHEYASEHLIALLQDVVQYVPELLDCADRLSAYGNVIRQKLIGDQDSVN